MDSYLVPPDAPVLRPDWPSVPGQPGHYERTGKDDDGTEVARWIPGDGEPADSTQEPVKPEDVQAALEAIVEVLSPLTGDMVDLEVFVGKDVEYGVLDAKGEKRQFLFPADPGFEIVMAFFDAYDAYDLAQTELAITNAQLDRAKKPAETARLRAQTNTRKGRMVAARTRTVATFLELVRIRQPDTTHADLSPGIGATALEHWMKVVIFRLNQARLGTAITAITAAPPKVPEPRAARRAQKRRR
jgi:orotidine-5'-phosphate decarboxylase